jgi:glycine oxidase
MSADVVVIGCGIVGMCSALALADRRFRVCLIGESRSGEASPAAAGILGPSLEDTHGAHTPPAVHRFAVAARDRYVGFVADLSDRSGVSVGLNRLGILDLALDADGAESLRQSRSGQWVDRRELETLEPAVTHAVGAMYYESDGAVDNVAMLRALRDAIECTSRIARIETTVVGLTVADDGVTCHTSSAGEVYRAPRVVLASGAWVAQLSGLPRPLPVDPLRGQMFAVGAAQRTRPRHVIYGPRAYVVPRGERILVGATLERVGFDSSTTPAGLAQLRADATAVWPAIADAPMASSWAGLRPVTPDFLPIIGPDPDYPALIYACGHSRNGILLGPLTGDCIGAVVAGDRPPADISAFSVDRFSASARAL